MRERMKLKRFMDMQEEMENNKQDESDGHKSEKRQKVDHVSKEDQVK